jgi:hypothetical protein
VSARSLSESGGPAASLIPRARLGSEAVDVDRGQLVYPSLKDVTIIVQVHASPLITRATHRGCVRPIQGGHGSLAAECSTLLKTEAVQAFGPPRSAPVLLRITAW